MWPETSSHDVVRLIQLAIAPVFLLTAISATLSVLATRIGRVVDRGRELERLPASRTAQVVERRREIKNLERRAKLIYWAMTLGTVAAIQIAVLIASAFIGYVWNLSIAWLSAVLFVGAMFSYTSALVCLLREVRIAIANFRLVITEAETHTAGGP